MVPSLRFAVAGAGDGDSITCAIGTCLNCRSPPAAAAKRHLLRPSDLTRLYRELPGQVGLIEGAFFVKCASFPLLICLCATRKHVGGMAFYDGRKCGCCRGMWLRAAADELDRSDSRKISTRNAASACVFCLVQAAHLTTFRCLLGPTSAANFIVHCVGDRRNE